MGFWGDYRFLQLRDAHTCVNQKVNLIAVVLEFGFPKTTRGSDLCCSIRIVDETHQHAGMAVNIFDKDAEKLPHVAAAGDIIQLHRVTVSTYNGEVNVVFSKKFSSFALYKGKGDHDFAPYQVSSMFRPKDEDKIFIADLRKWLANFRPCEVASDFPMFREIKEGHFNLACKILHCEEAAKHKWFVYVWDGTDAPPNAIYTKLEDETKSPLPLQLEPLPLSRELLCTFPTVGSILRITFDLPVDENQLRVLIIGKWVKFVNLRLKVHAGLWLGVFTPFTKLRYTPNEDCLIVERQRLYDERISLKTGKMPQCSLPKSFYITEVNHDRVRHFTLMDVLTHSEVTAKFKCAVRVVAVMPCQAEELCAPDGTYLLRLTLEDPTARIHAYVAAEDGETLFDGYPGMDKVKKELNRLLGVVAECGDDIIGVRDTPRNPPWVTVCLKAYYLNKDDMWATRNYRIFDTKMVEEA